MRISVIATDEALDQQTRAYAEFRLFSTLVRCSDSEEIHEVLAVLIPPDEGSGDAMCSVSVVRTDRHPIRVSASGRHAYDAIDRAAARVTLALTGDRDLEACDVNMYRILGDLVASDESRALARQLVDWHDAMVKHLRQIRLRGASCDEECPHDEARTLWRMAVAVFGDEAEKLTFLHSHGGSAARPPARTGGELHA